MRLLEKIRAYRGALRHRASRGTPELLRILRRRPSLLLGVSAFESSLLACGRLDTRLKLLAQLKTSALIGCPF